jgi:hypothetical protein
MVVKPLTNVGELNSETMDSHHNHILRYEEEFLK